MMTESDDLFTLFRKSVRDDLLTLALLHDREISGDDIQQLKQQEFPSGMGLTLRSTTGKEAADLMAQGLADIPEKPDENDIDILAADYADIYLTHGLKASPCESVWIDEEELVMQEAMFQIRGWYEHYGLEVPDWRVRTDDHLVYQLQFLHLLFDHDDSIENLSNVTHFMDEHILRWIEQFAVRVTSRCSTSFYAGLTMLTAAYLNEVRDIVAKLVDKPRPSAEDVEKRMRPKVPSCMETPYVPGVAPSW